MSAALAMFFRAMDRLMAARRELQQQLAAALACLQAQGQAPAAAAPAAAAGRLQPSPGEAAAERLQELLGELRANMVRRRARRRRCKQKGSLGPLRTAARLPGEVARLLTPSAARGSCACVRTPTPLPFVHPLPPARPPTHHPLHTRPHPPAARGPRVEHQRVGAQADGVVGAARHRERACVALCAALRVRVRRQAQHGVRRPARRIASRGRPPFRGAARDPVPACKAPSI
jgi:hypothetical protein